MRKRKIILGLFLLFITLIANTQNTGEKPVKKFRFQSINQMGLIKGESESSMLFQSVNGATYKTWFAGIGLGVDGYFYNSMPVFVDVRKHFKDNRGSVFVYADGGVALPLKRKNKNEFGITTEYGSGLYYDAGLGYHFQLHKSAALVMSMGYTEKNVERKEKGLPFFFGDGPQYVTSHDYRLKRLSFKIGFVF